MKLGIGKKLVIGFISVSIIAGIVGAIGTWQINKLSQADTFMYEKCTVPLVQMAVILESFQQIRITLYRITLLTTKEEVSAAEGKLAEYKRIISENSALFQKTIITEEGRKISAEFDERMNAYYAEADKIMEKAREGKDKDVFNLVIYGKARDIGAEVQKKLAEMEKIKVSVAEKTAKDNSSLATTAAFNG